jgi:hypothetical protein
VEDGDPSASGADVDSGINDGYDKGIIASTSVTPRDDAFASPSSFRRNNNSHRRMLYLDARTVRAVRDEVYDLPLPATLSTVCLALRSCDAVLESYADADPSRITDDGSMMKCLEIVGTYLSEMSVSNSSSSSISPMERRDARKEEFRKTCMSLASGGNGNMMKSWEEVRGGLSRAFLLAKANDDDAREEYTTAVEESRGIAVRGIGDHRSHPPKKTPPKRAHCSSPKGRGGRPTSAPPSVVIPPPPAARGSFLSMESFRKQIRQRMGRTRFHQVFQLGEILESRPSVPLYDETAARLDEEIKKKEMELPSRKRTDEIIAAKEREDREREALESAMKLMRPLTSEERDVVIGATRGIGPPGEILASQDADSVQRGSMQTLRPGQWLNDEVINYFLKNCLAKRDEMLCAKEPGRRRSHFFNSFFVQTMFDEKNNDPNLRGRYNYKNVRRWSKKVPGKDIFNLKYILCPINLDNTHWTSAVIFMEAKRIQYYDSMGGTDRAKLEGLLEYVKDEYRAKNGKDMDVSEWKLVSCTKDTPRQRNGELYLFSVR